MGKDGHKIPLLSIYCHTSPSGKSYVGLTSDFQKRWRNGRGYDKNFYFYRAILKYGWNSFTHEILFSGLDVDEAVFIERDLIARWNLTDKKFGYNLRAGGDGPLSKETRQKMSESRMGNTNCKSRMLTPETKIKISESLRSHYKTHKNPFKGRHHTEQTKELLKNRKVSACTRRKMSENHADVSGANNPSSRAVIQTTINGEFVCFYPFAKAASDKLSIDLSSIIKCCREKKRTCGGFCWKYAKELD